MRILLLADIHANWPALRAIQEPFDVCFFLGDLVDYGAVPVPCLEWVQTHAQHAVRGNHDHAVAQRANVQGRNGFKYLSSATRQLSWELLQPEHLRFLASLPLTKTVTLGGCRFLLVHATPRDPLEEYVADEREVWARRLQNVDADVVCVGHTHQQFVLEIGKKLVVNPGSVGQPRDGDPRAAYAIWEDGRVELKRVAYAVEDAIREIECCNLPDAVKRLSADVLRTGARNTPDLLATPLTGLAS